MSRFKTKNIADSTEKLLDLLKIDYETLGEEEGCCGSLLLRTGQTLDALKVATLTAEKIKSKGFTEVITSCPGCYKTMSSEYPKIVVGGVPFRVRHISQLLFEYANELVPLLHRLNCRVSYHDPCHLGRHMGVYDEPRALIKMVPGIEFVEFKYNRSMALCCGAGGGVRSAFPEICREVAEALLKGLPEGVQILVTSCPFCNYNLGGTTKVKVLDLPEFLIKSWRSS